MDETSGPTAADSSGIGNEGVIMGSPAWTSGKINGSLSFNGSTDYVKIPNNIAPLDNATDFTISL